MGRFWTGCTVSAAPPPEGSRGGCFTGRSAAFCEQLFPFFVHPCLRFLEHPFPAWGEAMAEPALRAHEIGDGQLTLGLVGQMVFALDHLEQRPGSPASRPSSLRPARFWLPYNRAKCRKGRPASPANNYRRLRLKFYVPFPFAFPAKSCYNIADCTLRPKGEYFWPINKSWKWH